jgi:putative transposase
VGKGYLYREVLDHVIIRNERHLRRVPQSYLRYYHRWRTHLSQMTGCPHPRLTQRLGAGVIAVPEVGGLHHHYDDERRAAS